MIRAWVMQIALAVFTKSEEDGNVDTPIVKGESKLAISYFSSFKTFNLIEKFAFSELSIMKTHSWQTK